MRQCASKQLNVLRGFLNMLPGRALRRCIALGLETEGLIMVVLQAVVQDWSGEAKSHTPFRPPCNLSFTSVLPQNLPLFRLNPCFFLVLAQLRRAKIDNRQSLALSERGQLSQAIPHFEASEHYF